MKARNPLVYVLVLLIVSAAAWLMYMAWSDDSEIKVVGANEDKEERKPPMEAQNRADQDTLPTEFLKVVNDLQTVQQTVEKLTDTVSVLKADNKAKEATIMGLKSSAETATDHLFPPKQVDPKKEQEPKELGKSFDPAKAEKDESNSLLNSIVQPIMTTKKGKEVVDPNQIVWIQPLDSGYVQDKRKGTTGASSNATSLYSDSNSEKGLLDEVGSKAKNELGLETGKEPRWTIANGSVIPNSMAVTAFIGRIPVNGQLQDPWRFKISTGPNILMANDHTLEGLEKTIIQGTAIGNYSLRCVTGRIDTMTFIFADGRIVTHKAKNKKDGMGYITDEHANQCIEGRLITNAPEVITTLGVLGVAQGASQGVADGETQTTTTTDGSTLQTVVGSHLKNSAYTGVAEGIGDVKQYLTDRLGQYFDVIYVPAGKIIDVHIEEEIKIDYDRMGRKVQYDTHYDAANGFID